MLCSMLLRRDDLAILPGLLLCPASASGELNRGLAAFSPPPTFTNTVKPMPGFPGEQSSKTILAATAPGDEQFPRLDV